MRIITEDKINNKKLAVNDIISEIAVTINQSCDFGSELHIKLHAKLSESIHLLKRVVDNKYEHKVLDKQENEWVKTI